MTDKAPTTNKTLGIKSNIYAETILERTIAQDVANPLVIHEAYFKISETIIPPAEANSTTRQTTMSYP